MRYLHLIYPIFMSSLFHHTRALQFSAVATLVTAGLTVLPLLAADQYDEPYYANQIVQTFQKMGAQTTYVYNNGSLATSAFDFASYFSSTCYRPTTFDMPGCKEKFGPYANLKETYESGKLAMILSRVSYLKNIAKFLPGAFAISLSSAPNHSTSVSSSSSSSTDLTNRNERASQVWKLCVNKFMTREKSVRCYQRNIRLIVERTEPVAENLVY